MEILETRAAQQPPVAHRSKSMAALAAAVLGGFGAHWWYLGRRGAWAVTTASCLLIVLAQLYPVWWDSPPFLLLIIPITAGFIESLVISLKSDAWFDARYNPGSTQATATGWGPVIIAIAVTAIGSAVVLFGIALTVMHVYTALGWLDGYVR